MEKQTHSFIACDADYAQSRVVIFGAPFDGTTSYRPGARFAPSAIRNESYGIETFSPYLEKDLVDLCVFDAGDLELPIGDASAVVDEIEKFSAKIFADGKVPLMLGGEHLVTLGAVRAAAKKHPSLRIVHFDAHCDLRGDYLGVKLSHATVLRRCHDIVGDNRIFQFGIRSGDRSEFEWAPDHVKMCRFGFKHMPGWISLINRHPTYVTIDLDILDPSCFPGTGTPEAGGVSFTELHEALRAVSTLNIVGLDLVELSPPWDQSGASTALACKLLREILLMLKN